jgi:glycosyltransferase involved in cell wall biosynthesis
LRRALYGRLESLLNLFFTSAVVYPSQSGYDFAINNGYAPKNKTVCIPNGIDVQRFTQVTATESADLRREAGVSAEMPVVCAVARLAMEKNVGLVLEAVGQLHSQGLDFRFWMVGDGPERGMLAAQAQQLGLGDRIRFWGQRSDIPQLLAASNIFALASWYEGGRTQAAMEAQAAGLPCVLSDVGDHVGMVASCGLTFPEGDVSACAAALKMLLENPSMRTQMSQTARKKALTEYSLEKMTGEYDGLYRKLSANPR